MQRNCASSCAPWSRATWRMRATQPVAFTTRYQPYLGLAGVPTGTRAYSDRKFNDNHAELTLFFVSATR
jgi:hypothetical protein